MLSSEPRGGHEAAGLSECSSAAAPVLPTIARAQERERPRRIGAMMSVSGDDPVGSLRNAAFLQGLQHFGWTVGRNVRIEYRWGGTGEIARKHAAELVALAPDVILAAGSQAAAPLLQATRTIPIVFVHVPDPVGADLVASLARPGGNATGFTHLEFGIAAKWLELLREIVPNVTRGGCHPRSEHYGWNWTMGRNPERRPSARDAGRPDQCAKCPGHRSQPCKLRAQSQWRIDRDGQRPVSRPS